MEELKQILLWHAETYPLMEPHDVIKLLYQNEFGGEHLVVEEETSFQFLKEEMASLTQVEEKLLVPIGNGMYRFHLSSKDQIYPAEEVHQWFLQSNRLVKGSLTDFLKKIKFFKKTYADYPYSFSEEERDAYLAYYRGNAYPSVHHSKTYQEHYQPHYRLMHEIILRRNGLL